MENAYGIQEEANLIIKARGLSPYITGNKNNQGGTIILLMKGFRCKGNRLLDIISHPDQTKLKPFFGENEWRRIPKNGLK